MRRPTVITAPVTHRMFSHFRSRSARIISAAVVVAGVAAGSAPSAFAGTDGQQIALDLSYSNCAAYGPAADVTMTISTVRSTSLTGRAGR
jgi:hypothetical protein